MREAMAKSITRRNFMATVGATSLAAPSLAAFAEAPQILTPKSVKPVVISAGNGNHSKDADGQTGIAKAFKMITSGADVLDAVIAAVNVVELDPEDTSVGYGGLPNADGVLQLDACCMHGPLKRAGAVAAIEGVRTPSLVAQKVMQETDHQLLVGNGAQQFARLMGFKIENDLHTEKSRRLYLEWKRRTDPQHYLDPKKRVDAGMKATLSMVADGLIDPLHYFGTINCNGISPKGELAGVTTTSGLAFKIPGRVGDSPIIGAGLYVDQEVGAAGSTGRGEANLFGLCSFYIVECMRTGMSPKDAGIAACKRVVANTIEKRLLSGRGKPKFDLNFYILNARGEFAGVSLYEKVGNSPVKYAVCDQDGPRFVQFEGLIEGNSGD
jgi:N4-(beta-N-acetylglucosaminyl)-L-asparaginase